MEANVTFDASFYSFIDVDEVNARIISKLNSIYGGEIQKLSEISNQVSQLAALQNELEKCLKFATTEAPDKISRAIKSARDALVKSQQLQAEVLVLNAETIALQEKAEPLLEIITPKIEILQELKNIQTYQRWITSISELGDQLDSNLQNGVNENTLTLYKKLQESADIISESNCLHLKEYTCKALRHWHQILQDKLTENFNSVLKLIKWPFLEPNARQLSPSTENIAKLHDLISYLFCLDDNSSLSHSFVTQKENAASTSVPAIIIDFQVSCLPLQLLLKPLEIRFFYHFSGKRATNSRENPEWYLTQILRWASAHDSFLETYIQPILDKNNRGEIIAKNEFFRGLIRLVALKLYTDIPEIIPEDELFSTTVQETLNFEHEFRSLGYPSSEPSILKVLTQSHVFLKWRSLEEKFALELLDDFVTSSNAWSSEESNGLSRCGEQLLVMLQGITNRYKQLEQPGHRLQFLELQLEILDDFRVRILQLTKSELADPIMSNYCAILNTVHFIIITLSEWADAPFFIEMHYFREKFGVLEAELRASYLLEDCSKPLAQEQHPSSEEDALSRYIATVNAQEISFKQEAIESFNITELAPTNNTLDDVTGSAFDNISKLYVHIECEMLNVVSEHVLTEVRARSQGYRKQKWFARPSTFEPGYSPNDISPSFCPILEVLLKQIQTLKNLLAAELFAQIWQTVAMTLNKFIYEEVILENNFSEFGTSQLNYDMTKALFPIFAEYTKKPENHFMLIKEALILLTLPKPTALLLKDTLDLGRDDKDFPNFSISPVKALEESGVHHFTIQEAELVLKSRNDLLSL